MARRLLPLLDRVLIEKLAAPQKTTGGILLPETVSKFNEGLVRATGPGRRTPAGELVPLTVKEGDKVLLPDYGGLNVKLGEKDYAIFREDDLLGILTDE